MNLPIERGDLLLIVWRDHFQYQGKRPPTLIVHSWGKAEDINEEGIAIVQNEVQDADKMQAERVNVGQFILIESIIKIISLKSGKVAYKA